MSANTYAIAQLGLFLVVLFVTSYPLGWYINKVMTGALTWTVRMFGPLERALYRCSGVDASMEMSWPVYAAGLLVFNVLGAAILYFLQTLQAFLPFNPAHLGAVPADSAFNTAISFATNTSWQGYAGEATLGYLAQMVGLSSQSFLSAASGVAALIALLRGFARSGVHTIGNVWVDLTRITLYVLLPLSALFSTVTTSGGDGAVNSALDSYTPLGGLVPMALIQLGEVIFGGPGSGLYGMLLYAMMAVFLAALMVGRAPEYLGKHIEIFEMKMTCLAILIDRQQ